jgi:hypothetical protein
MIVETRMDVKNANGEHAGVVGTSRFRLPSVMFANALHSQHLRRGSLAAGRGTSRVLAERKESFLINIAGANGAGSLP